MTRVLVLGGTGFLGKAVTAAITAEPDLDAVIPERATWDICDKASLATVVADARPDMVINMAGQSSTQAGKDRLYDVNAFGHLNLLEALAEADFSGRVVFFSSSNIYGPLPQDMVHEDTPPRPVNHYSCAKLLGEHFCALFADRLDVTIVRPFSVIGIGQKEIFLIPKLADHFARRTESIELGNLDVTKDWVDQRDLAAMVLHVLRAAEPKPVVNFSNGETASIGDVIECFRKLSGHDPEITQNPEFIRPRDILHQCGDNTRIMSLGYARRYSLNETLHWIFDHYCEKGSTL